MKTTKPHEIIYITISVSPTEVDGDLVTLFALDDYSGSLFPFQTFKVDAPFNEIVGKLVEFMNGINAKYDPKTHAQSTTYYAHLPTDHIQLLKGMVLPNCQVIQDSERVQKAFKPVFEKMDEFYKNNKEIL